MAARKRQTGRKIPAGGMPRSSAGEQAELEQELDEHAKRLRAMLSVMALAERAPPLGAAHAPPRDETETTTRRSAAS